MERLEVSLSKDQVAMLVWQEMEDDGAAEMHARHAIFFNDRGAGPARDDRQDAAAGRGDARRQVQGVVMAGTDGRVPGELQEELGAHEKGIEAAARIIAETWHRHEATVDDWDRGRAREAVDAFLAATDLVSLAAVVEALRDARLHRECRRPERWLVLVVAPCVRGGSRFPVGPFRFDRRERP